MGNMRKGLSRKIAVLRAVLRQYYDRSVIRHLDKIRQNEYNFSKS